MTRITRISTVIGITTVTIVASVTLGRGWIRSSAIPAYVNFAYKNDVNNSFAKAFSSINPKLAVYGINFQATKYNHDGCQKGDNVQYHGLHETINCSRAVTSKPYQINSEFTNHWQLSSQSLENFLLDDGWKKQWNQAQPIDQVYSLSNESLSTSVGVVYRKHFSQTYCELSITYQPNAAHALAGYINESCNRDIKLFGGY